ncbi:MAG: DUF1698 domain-containing protein [Humidesulfovibrio sp.]
MSAWLFVFTAPEEFCRQALEQADLDGASVTILKNQQNPVTAEGCAELRFTGHLEPNAPLLVEALSRRHHDRIVVVCGKKYHHANVIETILDHPGFSHADTELAIFLADFGLVPWSAFRPEFTAEGLTDELMEHVNSLWWYHNIRLSRTFATPGLGFHDIWDQIRQTRLHMDYQGKLVLDLATFNGLFAFEAEALGARKVVGTDTFYSFLEHFLLVRRLIGSDVLPFFNVSPYNLVERLDVMPDDESGNHFSGFDIIQNFGLMYYLRDPLLAFSQARSMISEDGLMIVETGALNDTERSFMAFNHAPGGPEDEYRFRFYPDVTTWWMPSIKCLCDMLRASFFEPLEHTLSFFAQPGSGENAGRVCLLARPLPVAEADPKLRAELSRGFRNPGMAAHLFR